MGTAPPRRTRRQASFLYSPSRPSLPRSLPAEPSQADELLTHRLRDTLALVDIRILDHLLVTGDTVVSFAERGLP